MSQADIEHGQHCWALVDGRLHIVWAGVSDGEATYYAHTRQALLAPEGVDVIMAIDFTAPYDDSGLYCAVEEEMQ